jgi:hypothetical protein
MSADLEAWEPVLGLDPRRPDFATRVEKLENPRLALRPSPTMRKFVAALTARYPELNDDNAGITAWADGPLIGDVSGKFIHVTMVWNKYDEAGPFFLRTAAAFGLDAYDAQTDSYVPAPRGKPGAAAAALIGATILAGNPRASRRAFLGGSLGLVVIGPGA